MSRSWILNFSLVLCACLSPSFAFAQSGTWTNTAGGSWPVSGNWSGGTIADGAGNTADFGTLDLGADATVTLDGARTIGNLTFGDTGPSHNWILNTGSGGTLTLDGGTPTITVTNQTATINAVVGGSSGLLKSGAGTLVLGNAGNSFSGGVAISDGAVEISAAGHLPSGNALTLSGGGALRQSSGTMNLANTVNVASGQSGALVKTGTGSTTLSGNYSGVAGTLTLDVTGATTNYGGFLITSTVGPAAGSVVNILGTTGSGNVQVGNTVSLASQAFFANSKVSITASGGGNTFLAYGNGVTSPNAQFGALDGGNATTLIGFDNRTGTVTIQGTADGNFAGTIFNGTAAGAAKVVKNGGSTQIFSGTNSYTGGTTVTGGILQIGSASNLPSAGGLTLSGGGALNITGAMTLASNVTITTGQTGTIKTTGPFNVTLSGNYSTMAGTLTLDMTSATVTPWQGFVAGNANGPTGTVNVNGSSSIQSQINLANASFQNFFANAKVVANTPTQTLYFAGANTATGMQFGALDGGNSNVIIGFDNSGTNRTVTINGTASGNFAGSIFNGFGSAGPVSLVKTGVATQTLSGTNSYTGTTSISGGILQIGAAANLPTASALTITNGAALNMSASMTLANSVTVASGQTGTLKMMGATSGTLSGNYSGVAGTLTLDVSGGSGYSGFLVGSANGPALGSVVNVIGPASGIGNTQIGLNNSAYQAFFANAKVSFSNTGNIFVAGGNGSATNITFGALDGGLSSTNTATNQGTTIGFDNRTGTVTITGTADGNFAGTIFNGNGGAGALNVIKNGSSVQTFSGTNSYTGTTTVSNGTLLVNGTHTGGAGYSVASGATLGGSGSIGSSTFNIDGTLAPGTSIESLLGGTLNFNNGSTFAYELNSSSLNGDLLRVGGDLNLTGTVTLSLAEEASGVLAMGSKLTLINYSGTWNSGTFFGYANGSTFVLGSNTWQINYNDITGGDNFASDQTLAKFVTLTVVPEPSSLAMLAFGVLSLWLFRKRN